MTKTPQVTRKQAEAVLSAVERKHHWYLMEFALTEDGGIDFETMVPVTNSTCRPHLVENCDGAPYAIVWESNSPDDWAINFYEDIKGVFCEAIMSFVLGIYPL